MKNPSPYEGLPTSQWLETTRALLDEHPLKVKEIIELVNIAWEDVWSTVIGKGKAQLSLHEVNPPATVVGYFFEKLLGKELAARYPEQWVGGTTGSDKDLCCKTNPKFSIEVKSSGQLGLKIFGNRSYGQEVENVDRAKKDKSGYYITVNFFKDKLTLIRFGWIDGSDWAAQKSSTGQMAGLGADVYSYKLIPIGGDYVLDAPIQLLNGVGEKLAETCNKQGFMSVRDVLNNRDKLSGKLKNIYDAAVAYQDQYGA
ncbi:MAG: hypothetical protein NVS3B3_03450 [Aquirhabdus sp.]